jgi:hypothetical protein
MQFSQKMTFNIILTQQLTAVKQPQSSGLNDKVFKDFGANLLYAFGKT